MQGTQEWHNLPASCLASGSDAPGLQSSVATNSRNYQQPSRSTQAMLRTRGDETPAAFIQVGDTCIIVLNGDDSLFAHVTSKLNIRYLLSCKPSDRKHMMQWLGDFPDWPWQRHNDK